MFKQILIVIWAFIFGSVAVLVIFSRFAAWLLTRIPRQAVFISLLALILISAIYAIVELYRQGISRASR